MNDQKIVAVGLLTEHDLRRLGPTFKRVWKVDETPCFGILLAAIDDADRDIRHARSYRADQSEDRGTYPIDE